MARALTGGAATRPPIGFEGRFALAMALVAVILLVLDRAGVPGLLTTDILVVAAIVGLALAGLRDRTMQWSSFLLADRAVMPQRGALALTSDIVAGPLLIMALGADIATLETYLPGLAGGLVLAAALIVGPFRTVGGSTIGDFLAYRTGSPLLRLAAAIVVMIVCLPILVAFLSAAGLIGMRGFGWPFEAVVVGCVLLACGLSIFGGMRGAGRVQIACLWLIAAAILLPFLALWPRMATDAVPVAGAAVPVEPSLPPLALGAVSLSLALGVAAFPTILARQACVASVAGTRRTLFWASALSGLFLLLLIAIVTLQHMEATAASQAVTSALAGWVVAPELAGMPAPLSTLVGIGLMAAALSATVIIALTASLGLSHDIVGRLFLPDLGDQSRLVIARLFLVVVAALAGWLALVQPVDVVTLLMWGLTLSAGALFPALVFAVWWRRATAVALLTGIISGLAATLAAILLTAFGPDLIYLSGDERTLWFGLPNTAAGLFGVFAATIAIVAIGLSTDPPDRQAQDRITALRLPRSAPLLRS